MCRSLNVLRVHSFDTSIVNFEIDFNHSRQAFSRLEEVQNTLVLPSTENTDSSLDMPSLVKVLVDTYAVGIPVSGQITRNLDEDVSVRVLAAKQWPDITTSSAFRPHIWRPPSPRFSRC